MMSTHTLEVAETLCDRVAIIAKGTIRACGTMAELRVSDEPARRGREQIFLVSPARTPRASWGRGIGCLRSRPRPDRRSDCCCCPRAHGSRARDGPTSAGARRASPCWRTMGTLFGPSSIRCCTSCSCTSAACRIWGPSSRASCSGSSSSASSRAPALEHHHGAVELLPGARSRSAGGRTGRLAQALRRQAARDGVNASWMVVLMAHPDVRGLRRGSYHGGPLFPLIVIAVVSCPFSIVRRWSAAPITLLTREHLSGPGGRVTS